MAKPRSIQAPKSRNVGKTKQKNKNYDTKIKSIRPKKSEHTKFSTPGLLNRILEEND